MDLESVRSFAEERKLLEYVIANYEPGQTGHEEETPVRRFEHLWERLNGLAGGSLDRSSIGADDGEGTSVTITRKAEIVPGDAHSGLLHYANSLRSIEAQWVSGGQEFPPESLTDREVLGSIEMSEIEKKLGILEESVTSLEKMLSDNSSVDTGLMFVDPARS